MLLPAIRFAPFPSAHRADGQNRFEVAVRCRFARVHISMLSSLFQVCLCAGVFRQKFKGCLRIAVVANAPQDRMPACRPPSQHASTHWLQANPDSFFWLIRPRSHAVQVCPLIPIGALLAKLAKQCAVFGLRRVEVHNRESEGTVASSANAHLLSPYT